MKFAAHKAEFCLEYKPSEIAAIAVSLVLNVCSNMQVCKNLNLGAFYFASKNVSGERCCELDWFSVSFCKETQINLSLLAPKYQQLSNKLEAHMKL